IALVAVAGFAWRQELRQWLQPPPANESWWGGNSAAEGKGIPALTLRQNGPAIVGEATFRLNDGFLVRHAVQGQASDGSILFGTPEDYYLLVPDSGGAATLYRLR